MLCPQSSCLRSRKKESLNTGQIVNVRQMDQSISKTAVFVECSQFAVVSIYQKWPNEGTVGNQRQGHGQPRLSDACGELPLFRLLKKLMLVLIGRCQNTQCITVWMRLHSCRQADPCQLPKAPTMGM